MDQNRNTLNLFEDNDLTTELRLGLPGTDDQPEIKTSLSGNKRSSSEMGSNTCIDENESTLFSPPAKQCVVGDGEWARGATAGGNTAPPGEKWAKRGGGRGKLIGEKEQVVGWPPVRSYRKSILQVKKMEVETGSRMYVKVSMDGAPYLRKLDLKMYTSYEELIKGLQDMFKCIIGLYSEREGYNGSHHALTYEDKEGDWMLVGDVPWEMFLNSCKRLRIMKSCEARGLGGSL